MYPNAHTHRIPSIGEVAVVNLDRDAIEVPEEGYWSAGIHPWFIKPETLELKLQRLNGFLQNPQVVAVGECGLDRLARIPMELQHEVFRRQLEIAREFNKPLIIHNVRAGSELLQYRKQYAGCKPWLLHGFTGSLREAELFLQQGCYLGFGKHLFNPKSKAAEVCAMTPAERILPETDASDIPVSVVIEKIAEIKGISPNDMIKQLFENFSMIFLETAL